MKHNVNFILFGLIIVCMLAMGFMVWQFESVNRINEEKNAALDAAMLNITTTAEALQEREDELYQKERVLSDYIDELNLSKERETTLGVHFTDLKDENDYLEDKLNKTLIDRDSWLTKYEVKSGEYDVCKVDYQQEKYLSEQRMTEIIRIRNLKPSMSSHLDTIKGTKTEVKDELDDIEDLASDIKSLTGSNSTISDKADDIEGKISVIANLLDEIMDDVNSLEYSISRI